MRWAVKKLAAILWIAGAVAIHGQTAEPDHDPVRTPQPPYPAAALAAHVTGAGTCTVAFDAAGRPATATMTKSTGSQVLDSSTLNWARSKWTGHPSTTVNVPISFIIAPKPRYPLKALTSGASGKGRCTAFFDAKGQVSTATMAQSTGSQLLDENTVSYARANWFGPPHTTVTLPVDYELPLRFRVSAGTKYLTPKPPYPADARMQHEKGAGSIKVTFDANGDVISAAMVQSTGSSILDENSTAFATIYWKSLLGYPNSTVFPIRYALY